MNYTDYEGIDYGLGKANIGDNGIRYGVINQNAVIQAWCDDSEPVYYYMCPHCDYDLGNEYEDICPSCEGSMEDSDFEYFEPIGFNYSDNEYKAECTDEMADIFVLKSPFYTFAQFCSPCAPGAVHLENPLDHESDNNKGYCFGHDWFESGKAPYPVYSVETNELINP